MDNIVTLIVIFIVLGSMTRKFKARQKAKQGATPPDGGWLTKLKAALADIQRQIEQQSKGRTSGASGWDHLLDGGEPYSSQPDADEAALDDRVFEEGLTQPHPDKMPPAAPLRAPTFRSDKTRVVPGVTRRKAVHAGQPSCATMAVSRADLRQAVIWAEILGPPVALRDQRGGRR
jgi:hypothetical protein